jgi:hypothetical protein
MTGDAQVAFDLEAPQPAARDRTRRPPVPPTRAEPEVQQPARGGHLTDEDLARLPPTVDLLTAARILGIARTTAYRLVRGGRWPTDSFRAGERIRVPRGPLLALLGIAPNGAPWLSTDPSAAGAPSQASADRGSQSLTPPGR